MEVEYDDSGWQGRAKQHSGAEVCNNFDAYVNTLINPIKTNLFGFIIF